MSNFSELINKDHPVLIDFSAEWCGPCKMLAPILHEVKNKFGDGVTIVKIDVDKNQQAAEAYKIQGVPTLILFKNGKQLWRQSGIMPAHEIEKVIQPYL